MCRFESGLRHQVISSSYMGFRPIGLNPFPFLCETCVRLFGLPSRKWKLKRFFQWLTLQPGYKSRVRYTDSEYFNLSEKDTRTATAKRQQNFPTIEQVRHVIAKMLAGNEIERRNRALVAFTLLTGARDSAIASLKLKHVDLIAAGVHQDAREVKTKFSKTFSTFFFPVGEEVQVIVAELVYYLRKEPLWGNDEPLFPATPGSLLRPKLGLIGKSSAKSGFPKSNIMDFLINYPLHCTVYCNLKNSGGFKGSKE